MVRRNFVIGTLLVTVKLTLVEGSTTYHQFNKIRRVLKTLRGLERTEGF